MKYTLLVTTALMAVSSAATAEILRPAPLQSPSPVTEVLPLEERDTFVLCGGSAPTQDREASAYYDKGTDLIGRLTRAVGKPVVQMEGGTLTCAHALAEGRADAAIAQDDVIPWLASYDSPLLNVLGYGGAVLTEAVMALCNRDGPTGNEEDFGWIGQDDDYIIAIAGSTGAGANITLNAVSAEDEGWKKPRYVYGGSWSGAMQAVADGQAACAVGVSYPFGDQWETLDDQFGGTLRLLEIYDKDWWRIEGLGGNSVYGQLQIPEDDDGLDDFLDWRGTSGAGTWDPEMPGVNASVYYRTDAVPGSVRDSLRQAAAANADTLDFNNR